MPHIHAAKHAKSIFEGFKSFAFKGNVIDLAVGVIIGGAFGNIVKSLVDNIIMPTVGVLLPGKRGYEDWYLPVRDARIPFGKFLGDVVNFLIVAFALYLFIVKFVGWIMAFQQREQAKEIPALTKDQQLLEEIRDLLKERAGTSPGGAS
ncbi:large conductance mechanosensitive channel protein MscL [Isosphaeraceae bacterium EP7]